MSEIACSQQLGVFVVHLSACFGRLGFYIFSLVFLSTFPVVIPFLVIKDVNSALHVWQLVSLAMLYLSGSGFGRYAGFRPWKGRIVVTVIGLAMVGITIAFGG